MRKIFVYAVLADLLITALVLYNQIKEFLLSHPWWVSVIAALPEIAVPIFAYFELRHSAAANELRTEANNHRIRANTLEEGANGLRSEQAKSLARIGEVQAENIKLQAENVKLQAERNEALSKIAANTQRVPTEAEHNANILRKYRGQCAAVSVENGGNWGHPGVIADISDSNVLTLFTPAGSSGQATGVCVRCDDLRIVELKVGSCPVQLHVLKFHGNPFNCGNAKTWEEINTVPAATARRGSTVFHVSYRKDGTSKKKGIHIYASTDGSPNYSLVTFEDMRETDAWYHGKMDIEKKFAIIQIEWLNDGWKYDGGSGQGSLFLLTKS